MVAGWAQKSYKSKNANPTDGNRSLIDERLLTAYVAELEALRDHGRDFARAYPDIAGHLDIGPRRSRDPHVERVVESAAFLAARLRLMVENSATEIPMAMLATIAPSLLEPVPSMALLTLEGGSEPTEVPRGTRFDFQVGAQALVCFSTTSAITAAPLGLRLRRLDGTVRHPDGISIELVGIPPRNLTLSLGNNEPAAAVLMDAFAEHLTSIELFGRDSGVASPVPTELLHIHGFGPEDAALPIRPATHPAHRLLTEFMVFPEKFRFVSLRGLPLASGSRLEFRFSRRLRLPTPLPDDLISVNRVPAVNLWRTAATPFEITGRQLEYPARADALRYRTVECHSVEDVYLYGPDGGSPERLDPVMSQGNIRGTAVRWIVRRTISRMGGEVLLCFHGLDYSSMGTQRLLVAPTVLASNRDIAGRISVGSKLVPVSSLGDWGCALASAPTPYKLPLTDISSMETLISYLRAGLTSLVQAGGEDALKDYLNRFPGSERANWISGINGIELRSVAAVRAGNVHPGSAVVVALDSTRSHTASQAMIARVLGEVFESQRGLNRVEDMTVEAN